MIENKLREEKTMTSNGQNKFDKFVECFSSSSDMILHLPWFSSTSHFLLWYYIAIVLHSGYSRDSDKNMSYRLDCVTIDGDSDGYTDCCNNYYSYILIVIYWYWRYW